MALPFFNRFPYTNIGDINLDWIIKQVKLLTKRVEDLDPEDITERLNQVEAEAAQASVDAASAASSATDAAASAASAVTAATAAQTTANAAQTAATAAQTTATAAQTAADLRVLKAGDTMTGDLQMQGTYTDTIAPTANIETPKVTFIDSLGALVGKLSMKFMTDGVQKLILLAKRGNAQNYLELGFDSDGNPIVNSNRKAAWRTMLGMEMFQISGNSSITIPLAGAERAVLFSCAGDQSVSGIVLLYCANTSGNVYYYDVTGSLTSFTFTAATNSITIANNFQYGVMLCKIKFSV